MKNFITKGCLITLGLGILLTQSACKKDVAKDITVKTVKAGPIPSYNFNWETATYMPSSPANSIPMPWNSGTTQIDPGIVSDYKSNEGWVLVYNTFAPTTPATGSSNPYYFALYNKYRGILRFYVWQPPTATSSTYINHGLSIYSTTQNSPILGFEGEEFVPLDNPKSSTNIVNQSINANGGTWFALQYQIVYDPTVAQSTFPNFGLGLNAKYINVTDLKLNGTQTGTVTGTIGAQQSSFDLNGTLTDATRGFITAKGVDFFTAKPEAQRTTIDKQIISLLGAVASKDFSSVLNLLLGTGGGGGTQYVDLKLQTKIDLAGTAVSGGGLLNLKLALPGQSNSQTADGLTPAYNEVMGVFNLASRPTVYVQRNPFKRRVQSTRETELQRNIFTCDLASVSLLVNPSVSAIANITNLKKDLVFIYSGTFAVDSFNGTKSEIETRRIFVNTDNFVFQTKPAMPLGNPLSKFPFVAKFGVRLTFDVEPKNGSPKTTIVKTFEIPSEYTN